MTRCCLPRQSLLPDGLPEHVYRCAGRIGSLLLFAPYSHLPDGRGLPPNFAASKPVFIPKSTTADDGRICAISRCIEAIDVVQLTVKFSRQHCSSAVVSTRFLAFTSSTMYHNGQKTDNIFEVESAAFAHCLLYAKGFFALAFRTIDLITGMNLNLKYVTGPARKSHARLPTNGCDQLSRHSRHEDGQVCQTYRRGDWVRRSPPLVDRSTPQACQCVQQDR